MNFNQAMLFFQSVQQPIIDDPSRLTDVYERFLPQSMARVYPYATEFFYALALLQFSMLGWRLWRRNAADDLRTAMGMVANELLVVGAFLALLLNGPQWMSAIINMFITVGKAGSGVNQIQPSAILTQGISIFGALTVQAAKSAIFSGPLSALSIAVLFAGIMVVIAYLVITVEFVFTKVQTFLVLSMGLFFLCFGASSWTRGYVERYFAYAVSSGVRLMTLYFLISIGSQLSTTWVQQAQAAPWSVAGAQACLAIMSGAIIYAVICVRGSALAAQILGGGVNLSHGEVFSGMGQAVGAGVSAALVASGVGGLMGGGAAGKAVAATGSSVSGGATGAAPTSGATPNTPPGGKLNGVPMGGGSGSGAGSGSGSTPKVGPRNNGGGGGGGGTAGLTNAAASVANTLKGIGAGGGHHATPPQFRGFHGD